MKQQQGKPLYKKWWFWAIVVVVVLGAIGSTSEPAQVTVPDVVGKTLSEAESTLNDEGFTRIEVESESGDLVISKSDWAVISQTPEAGEEASENDTIVLRVENIIEKEQEEIKKEEEEISALAGGKMADAMSVLSNLGYTVVYEHERTGLDFAGEVGSWGEDELSKWVVTGVDNIDSKEKTVTVRINTQENIDAQIAEENKRKALEEKLPVEYAWQAVEQYGETQYPYGFDLHWMIGKLAEEADDENTWFLKAECKVKNAYGATMQGNCEAQVTGTQDNPQVTYFMVY